MEPHGGQPATEKTEVWVFFDDDNVYVTFAPGRASPIGWSPTRCAATATTSGRATASAFSLDTFYDRRNAFQFEVNPLGGAHRRPEHQRAAVQRDWNPVWDVAVGRFEGGWTVEAAIPFKSLRYRPGRAQVWGFNARRNNRWKNEISYLDAHSAGVRHRPRQLLGVALRDAGRPRGAAGLEEPRGEAVRRSSNLTTDLAARHRASPTISTATSGSTSKYGVTQNLTADFTYNTDFAQVEADEQQVNLTRFSLFFPEKREFFLENQGTFAFGGAGGDQTGGRRGDTPILFYSRRIGLDQGPRGARSTAAGA